MKILVTGGAGYIGSTLVPMLLERQQQVRVFDCLLHGGRGLLGVWAHPLFEFVRGDVRDAGAARSALQGCDAVVHLAAIVGDPACARDAALATAVNLDASRSLFDEAARAEVKRFVFASTCSNYGRMAGSESYVDENSELRPVSLYAETKVAVEKMVLGQQSAVGPTSTVLRFATVFGVSPRMRFDLTVNEFAMEMITKKHLTVFGEQFWRPYIHVRDAARAIVTVLSADTSDVAGQVFNAGSTDQNYQKQQLVELIRPFSPDAKVQFVKKQEDPRDYRVSFQKIAQQLGFVTSRSVNEGVSEIAALVRSGIIEDYGAPEFHN